MKRLILLLAALPSLATAHTLTVNFANQPAAITLAHDGKFDPVPQTRIKNVVAVDARGAPVAAQASAAGAGTTIATTARMGAVWVDYAGPPAGATATGERRVGPKGTHADALNVGRSQVYALAVQNPNTRLDALPTGRLALVPISPLRSARAGSTLRIKVTYAGAPLPNATVRLNAHIVDQGGPTVSTDANGEASITLGPAGRVLYAVSHAETPSSDPSVDTLRLQASLGFEVLQRR